MSDIFRDLISITKNEFASVAEDGTITDTDLYVDTGSYSLNALLSGSIFKGFPANKILGIQGESATGKTFFLLSIVKNFLDSNEEARVILFESESAISKKILEERNIDTSRVAVVPVTTVQEFRTQVMRVVDKYVEVHPDKSKRPPLLLGLDSLGMLSTTKEIEDIASGSETKDMSRPALIKGSFRALTLKLGKAGIPMIITNHVYASMSAFTGPTGGGGSGLKYAASMIVNLTKRKEKVGTEVVGNIITCTLLKGRDTKENEKAQVLLNYDTGLNKHYGLVDLAVEAKVFKKLSRQIEVDTGTKHFEGHIYKKPEDFFSEDVLTKLDAYAKIKYTYGDHSVAEEDNIEELMEEDA